MSGHKPLKIIILVSILLLCGLFALWDIISAPSNLALQSPQVKTISNTLPAPEFSFNTLDDKPVSSQTLKGKIIILNFWASWCTPCIAEFPDLLKLAAAFPQDVIFLGLSVDEDINNARTFIKTKIPPGDLTTNTILGHDADKTIAQDLFQTTMYPETYILSADYKIIHHVIGVIDWNTPEIHALINGLIDAQAKTK
jgi:thiol-disulfide isomerase/thioredoxin